MSPVYDPRFSEARWEKTLQKDREASDQAARMEYIKPLVMLVLGGAVVMGVYLLRGPEDPDEFSGAARVLLYPIGLAIELVLGVAGLWLAAKLWLHNSCICRDFEITRAEYELGGPVHPSL